MDQLYHDVPLFCAVIGAEQDTEISKILVEAYEFYKKYTGPAKSNEWCQLCREAKQINQKYNNSRLCRKIMVELLLLLEAEYV